MQPIRSTFLFKLFGILINKRPLFILSTHDSSPYTLHSFKLSWITVKVKRSKLIRKKYFFFFSSDLIIQIVLKKKVK